MSNLKQIGLGWMQYAQDYDDRVMPKQYSGAGGKIYYWWGSWIAASSTLDEKEGLLQPYMKNHQIQACTSFDNQLRAALRLTGYAYNNAYLHRGDSATAAHLAEIKSPAETVVMADSARVDFVAPYALQANTYLTPPGPAPGFEMGNYPTFHGRHNGMGVVLWADGHVKAMKPVYRAGTSWDKYRNHSVGDLDRDGNMTTNEYFDLE